MLSAAPKTTRPTRAYCASVFMPHSFVSGRSTTRLGVVRVGGEYKSESVDFRGSTRGRLGVQLECDTLAIIHGGLQSGKQHTSALERRTPSRGTTTGFRNLTAERYPRQNLADEASDKKKLAITQKYLAPEMRVLEFGCGTGSTAVIYAPMVKAYHVIDVSKNMIEFALGNAAEVGLPNIEFTARNAGASKCPRCELRRNAGARHPRPCPRSRRYPCHCRSHIGVRWLLL